MNNLLFIIGVIGNVLSFLVFLSPIKTFWRIVKNKSTEEFESAPYVITVLNSSLWVYYGLTKPGAYLVATINIVGVILETAYVILYLIYASPTLRAKTWMMVIILDVGFFGAVVLVTKLAVGEEMEVSVIGIVCACFNILMYASPLAVMRTVINMKSVEYMPFLLSFFLFLNGGVWGFYAILDKDIFLGLPNAIGCFFGAIQLILYMIYMNNKQGLMQHQPLIEQDEEEAYAINSN